MVDYQVRDALVNLADPEAAPFLARHLTTARGGWSYNARALTALLACGREAAFPPLAARLAGETDADGRLALLFALAWLNDKRALPILRELSIPPSDWAAHKVLPLAVAYLEAAPDGWLAPQWGDRGPPAHAKTVRVRRVRRTGTPKAHSGRFTNPRKRL
jgi:hypothetical protein